MTELIVDRNYYAGPDRAIAKWLLAVAALVFCMIVVGGATRLTDSGLSITEWKPILGTIPPLSDTAWETAFEKYKEIPEYHRVNKGMSLEGFKTIYWWEWSHRFLGRFIGLAFAVPLIYFGIRGRIEQGLRTQLKAALALLILGAIGSVASLYMNIVPIGAIIWLTYGMGRKLANRLLGLFALGSLQGVIGWYMVSSGLVDRVDVSQYRLALHLGVAFLILGCLVWLALDLWPRERNLEQAGVSSGQRLLAGILAAAVFLQVLLGALVAGLKAGLAYNTWPDMNGALIPSGLGEMSPWYLNLFENVTTVQFNHRMMAYGVAVLALWHAWSLSRHASESVRQSAFLVAGAVLVQIALGIWTLLAAVPLSLGLLHQGGAAVVFALVIRHWFLVCPSRGSQAPAHDTFADDPL